MQRNSPAAARGGPVVLRPVRATPCLCLLQCCLSVRWDITYVPCQNGLDFFVTSATARHTYYWAISWYNLFMTELVQDRAEPESSWLNIKAPGCAISDDLVLSFISATKRLWWSSVFLHFELLFKVACGWLLESNTVW